MMALGLSGDDRPFWITQGVAQAIGVNLTDAMAEGLLDRRGYMAMVSRCEACPFGEACAVWLSEQQGYAAGAPDYCPNAPAFDRLRQWAS